jgi:hypothetical protein
MVGVISGLSETQPVHAYQEVKETKIISNFLDDNFEGIKYIYRQANEMKKQALPFNSKKHRDRYRFEPNDSTARAIMSKSRELCSRFKLVNGILYHSSVPNRHLIFKESLESLDSIAVYSKRAIRAIKDNNYALYLASAEGIEKEAVALNKLLDELEYGINETIDEYDSKKESL